MKNLLIVVVLLTACTGVAVEDGGDTTTTTTTVPAPSEPEPATVEEASECEQAFAAAAAVDEMQDLVEDLFPAVRACTSLDEWSAASVQHPDALDGTDPELYLTNLCRFSPEVTDEPLCSEVD